jgi:helix-turn-helix protein
MENQGEAVVARTNADFIYPAGQDGQLDEKSWVKGGVLTVTNLRLLLSAGNANHGIMLKGLEDVEEKPLGEKSALLLTRYHNGQFVSCAISAPAKTIESLRSYFIQYLSDSFKTSVYFISPASKGGVIMTTNAWEGGMLLATQKSIWLISRDKQVRMGLNSIVQIRRESRKMGGLDRNVLTIDHLNNGESVNSIILCPDSTMDMLEKYLHDLVEKCNSLGEEQKLTEQEGQIATLIYSGVDSSTIQSMLNIDNHALDQFYDKLLGIGMAKVARVRRELELTPKGVKFVTDMMSNVVTEKK